MRLIRYLLLFFIISLVSSGYFFACTETGFQFLVSIVAKNTPGHLTIKHTSGKLFSQFHLQNISYQNTQQNIYIKSIDFAWNPLELITQEKIVVDTLSIDTATVSLDALKDNQNSHDLSWLAYFIVKQFNIKQFSLQKADTTITFNGKLTTVWDATWKVMSPHVNVFIPNATGSFSSSGTLSGPLLTPTLTAILEGKNLQFSNQKIKSLVGKLNIYLQPNRDSTLILTARDVKLTDYPFKNLDITLSGQVKHLQHAIESHANLILNKEHFFSLFLSFPKFTTLTDFSQACAGKIDYISSHVEFLTNFIPQIKNPSGKLHGTFILTGTLNQPHLTGSLNLSEGHVDLPNLGIHLEKINLEALNLQNNQVTYQGTFYSGSGKGHVTGKVDLTKTDFPAAFTLQGTNLQIINLSEYKVNASPDLKFNWANQTFRIEGNILIPSADIKPKNFGDTVTLSNDVIFTEDKKTNFTLPFSLAMQIKLQLGENIHIAYKDLQTNLQGHLQIYQNSASAPTASGELYAVKGTYLAYGQLLKIQEGRIMFSGGSLMNPGLNILAAKQLKTVVMGGASQFSNTGELKPIYAGTNLITVGVQIQGSLDHPAVSLYSSTAGLSQNDILSYLLFGYPQSQATTHQSQMLLSAASALNFSGKTKFNNVTEELQGKLGLSELNVESTDIFNPGTGSVKPTTSVVIGKQLAPNLYAHYSIGLFDPVSILNLRYQLSKRFAIQSETSSIDKGADLLYSIERN